MFDDDFDFGFYGCWALGTAIWIWGQASRDNALWAVGMGVTLLSVPCSKDFWEVVVEELRKRRLRRQDQWHDADNPYRDW